MKSRICPTNTFGCHNDGNRQEYQMSNNTWGSPTQESSILNSICLLHVTPESHEEQQLCIVIRASDITLLHINTKYLLQDTNFFIFLNVLLEFKQYHQQIVQKMNKVRTMNSIRNILIGLKMMLLIQVKTVIYTGFSNYVHNPSLPIHFNPDGLLESFFF